MADPHTECQNGPTRNLSLALSNHVQVSGIVSGVNTNNRILSKVQKSFWSCTHVNSFQKYTLYINLHILFNFLSKTTSNIQESRKSIKFLKR